MPASRFVPWASIFATDSSWNSKTLLLPGILVLIFASRGGRGELWFMLLFLPALIGALFRYWSYRYRFDRDELMIRQGIVFRSERHIPYARIQNIDLVQNPLHRLFRVAEVRLETTAGVLDGMLSGRLNAMRVAMTGKLQFKGEAKVAMSQQQVQADLVRLYSQARDEAVGTDI